MRFNDCWARIICNREIVDEYAIEESSDGRAITCWVPTKEGQAFKVQCAVTSPDQAVMMKLLADGEVLRQRASYGHLMVEFTGVRASDTEMRPFIFKDECTPIEDYDPEECHEMTQPDWYRRGTITLEMYKIQIATVTTHGPRGYKAGNTSLHTVKVGAAVVEDPSGKRAEAKYKYEDPERRPFATFHFKHRPQTWLEQYGFKPPEEMEISPPDPSCSKRKRECPDIPITSALSSLDLSGTSLSSIADMLGQAAVTPEKVLISQDDDSEARAKRRRSTPQSMKGQSFLFAPTRPREDLWNKDRRDVEMSIAISRLTLATPIKDELSYT